MAITTTKMCAKKDSYTTYVDFHTLCMLLTFCAFAITTTLGQDSSIRVEYSIVEESPPNTRVGNLSAHTHFKNQPLTGQQSRQFSFLPQSSRFQQFFTIDETHGVLRTNSVIDRDVASCERSMKCDMPLDVAVIGPDREFQIMKVTVHIEDINDNAPAFSSDTIELPISETALPGVSFVLPQAWDPDSGKFGVQSYRLVTQTDKFSLNVSLGTDGTVDMRLVLREKLDREERAFYTLEVVATDGGVPALTGTLTVEVQVNDANDNSPVFQQPSYEVRVREDTVVGDVILQVLASDPDIGPNADVVYSLASPTPNANPGLLIFAIRNTTGELVLQKPLDYEAQTAYHLLVTAKDRGPNAIPTQARVVVIVVDVNDHAPTISVNALTATGNAEIAENTDPGVFVAHVSIEDKDSGPSGEVQCVLSSGPFELRQLYRNVYKVIALSSFDTETQSTYVITLACHDNGTPPLRTSKDIYVNILDVNDHAPVFTQDVYSATLRENTSVGARVVQVNASDGDSGDNARLTYSILRQGGLDDAATGTGNAGTTGSGVRWFRIDPDTGVISTNGVLDYESMHKARLEVVAVDHGDPPRSSTAAVVVNIVDVNDEPPLFYLTSYSFSLNENSPANSELGAVLATDKDSEPFNDIIYILSTGDPDSEPFEVDSQTGMITTKRVLDREYKPSYNLMIFAGNPGYPKMTSSVQVTVLITDINDNAPTIIFPNNTSNTVNIPYGAPEGYIFTKVVAMDVDAGANAKLNYAIAKTSTPGLFEIDGSSGAVSIKSHDLWSAGEYLDMLITVSDQGTPPKTSSIEMFIVVNKSVVYPGRKDLYPGSDLNEDPLARTRGGSGGVGSLNQNQTVLISLGIVTVLLVTILIVAIILVRRRKYKDDDEDSAAADGAHGQNNFLKVTPTVKANSGEYVDNDTLPESHDSQESGVYSEESGDRGIKDVKFINNISGGILVKGGPQVSVVGNKAVSEDDPNRYPLHLGPGGGSAPQDHTWQRPGHHLQGGHHPHHLAQHHQTRPLAEHTGTNAQPKPWSLTQKELEAHQLLSRFPQQPGAEGASDSDSTSGCSAEVSTTDSGRGPSEDGDHLTPPVGGSENKYDDMTHPAATTTDDLHRTAGRGTRTGTRPPTGTKVVTSQGVRDAAPASARRQHPLQTTSKPHHGHYGHHGGHHTPSGGGSGNNNKNTHLPSGHARTSLVPPQHHVTSSAAAPAQSHSKQKRWGGGGGGGPEGRLTVSDQPPSTTAALRAAGKVKSNSHHHNAPYRAPTAAGIGRHVDPAATSGKALIWERFREHADGRALPVASSALRTLGSVQDTVTTQDEMSDDASTTSGSYVLDLDDVRHQQPPRRPVIVGQKDSFV